MEEIVDSLVISPTMTVNFFTNILDKTFAMMLKKPEHNILLFKSKNIFISKSNTNSTAITEKTTKSKPFLP